MRSAPTRTVRRSALPTASPRPSQQQRQRRQEERDRERVQAAAVFFADALGSTWRDAVTDRAAEYATDATWKRLFSSRRYSRNCLALARSARALLQGQDQVHGFLGTLARRAVSFAGGGGDVVQAFTSELIANIPLPWDAKILAVARGLQVTGILLCMTNGRQPASCRCFADLALAEAKTGVKNLLLAATADWTSLGSKPTR